MAGEVRASARVADTIRAVIARERILGAENVLAAYQDELPVLLPRLPVDEVAAALAALEPVEACRALFGNFRAVPPRTVRLVLRALPTGAIAALLAEMALGYDLPRRAARILTTLGDAGLAGLLAAEPLAAARIAGLMAPGCLSEMLAAASEADAARWSAAALAVATPAEAATLLDAAALAQPSGTGAGWPPAGSERPVERAWLTRPPAVAARRLDRLQADEAASALVQMPASVQRAALGAAAARRAAAVLVALATHEPERAGFLLGALAELVLVRAEGPQNDSCGMLAGHRVKRVLHGSRLRAVLACLNPCNARVAELLHHTSPSVYGAAVAGLAPNAAGAVAGSVVRLRATGWNPCPYPSVHVQGRRRSQRLGPTIRWTKLRESVEVSGRSEALRVDLLELDPARIGLRARQALGPRVPIVDAAARLGGQRGGVRPGLGAFVDLGLVRLADAAGTEGAVAGVNGGFYVDFGLCLDARDLGIDLSQEANLHVGDLVGWFVSDGEELAPPLFNRAVLAMTADGRPHICRVGMASVALPNGRRVEWGSVNSCVPTKAVLWDRLAGTTTAPSRHHVDVCVSRSRIVAIRPGGRSPIPLLGFVLAVPRAHAADTLAGVAVGHEVRIGNDFPTALGRVEQAMACGPQLVRDGQVDIDFDIEGFGDKDTTVLPLSLSRVVDTFRAARSFAMVRQGRLVFGVVSGVSMGAGPAVGADASAGMTFGELAQLCVDLDADDAVAFDGGGSSSLVAAVGGAAKVLNVPTGGSDVARGSERFIKTFWVALNPEDDDG